MSVPVTLISYWQEKNEEITLEDVLGPGGFRTDFFFMEYMNIFIAWLTYNFVKSTLNIYRYKNNY